MTLKQWGKNTIANIVLHVIGAIVLCILPLILPTFGTSLVTKILIFGILAMSLDIILGYTGLPSLGHAAFFAIGGYITGIMVTKGVHNFGLVLAGSLLATLIIASVFGLVANRTKGIYFLLVTFALGMLVYAFVWKQRELTGGDDGLPGILRPSLGIQCSLDTTSNFYFFTAAIFVICFLLMRRVVNSPFGYAIQGIRDNEYRMQALGYNVWLYKYVSFLIGAMFAGVAGILFAYFNQFMSPGEAHALTSIEVFLMCIIGGVGTLVGPVIGSAIFILLKYFVSIYTTNWMLIIGTIIILIVMFMPGGIQGYIIKLQHQLALRNHGSG